MLNLNLPHACKKGRNCSSTSSLFCVASQPFKVECVWYFRIRTLVSGYRESVLFSENTADATVGSCKYNALVMALIFLCSTFVQLNLNSSLEILHQFIMTKLHAFFQSTKIHSQRLFALHGRCLCSKTRRSCCRNARRSSTFHYLTHISDLCCCN